MIRVEFDADRQPDFLGVSRYRTVETPFEVRCSVCNGLFFATADEIAAFEKSIELGTDNPFVCDGCTENYESMSHER